MRGNKKIQALVTVILTLALLTGMLSVTAFASDSGDIKVTATATASVKQGNTGYCYVYIDSLENLSSLSVAVHYDSAKVSVSSSNLYNKVSSIVYDSTVKDSAVQFSYVFDGKGKANKTQLFYFTYNVLSDAEVGDSFFDIIVTDAYDSGLNSMPVSGSRCKFGISENVTSKTCSVYGTSSVSTSVNGEFTLSYRLSTTAIASGNFAIAYDHELFEAIEVTAGSVLTNKIYDINLLTGEICVSFVGTEYSSSYQLVTVKFRSIKNTTESSKIKLSVTELYDKDLNLVTSSGYTTTVNNQFDPDYTEDPPSMSLRAEYSNSKVTLEVRLDADSHLGAGDFVIEFDSSKLTLSSYEKGFTPTFFNVNDKKASEGVFKISIISLEDIVTEESVITLVFDAVRGDADYTLDFALSGSGLADSLTESIVLNFVDTSVLIPHLPVISPDFKIRGASLSLSNDINIVYKALIPENYTDAYMVFTFAGEDYTVYGTKNADGSYSYMFTEILPQMIGENIKATLYATNEYAEQVSVCIENYSVLTYCTNKLKSSTDAKFKTMLSDLLVYAKAAQVYAGYNTGVLVTDGLEGLMTPTEFSSVDSSANKQKLDGTIDNSAKWRSAGLLYENAMAMYIKFAATEINNLEVRISINGESVSYGKNDFILDSDGYYKLYFRGIYFTEFDDAVVATFMRNGVQVGQTLNYSVNTYIYKNQNHSDSATRELMRATYNYGASAKLYANK